MDILKDLTVHCSVWLVGCERKGFGMPRLECLWHARCRCVVLLFLVLRPFPHAVREERRLDMSWRCLLRMRARHEADLGYPTPIVVLVMVVPALFHFCISFRVASCKVEFRRQGTCKKQYNRECAPKNASTCICVRAPP